MAGIPGTGDTPNGTAGYDLSSYTDQQRKAAEKGRTDHE